jgi:hypothetical protein
MHKKFIPRLILISIFFVIIVSNVKSQGEQLEIDVEKEIFEGESLNVSVGIENEDDLLVYINGVDILYDDNYLYGLHEIPVDDEDYTINLLSLDVNEDTTVTITAEKTGYISDQETIIIKNQDETITSPELVLKPDTRSVDTGDPFVVIVVDQNDIPVEDVEVAIESPSNEYGRTDSKGEVFLNAPKEWDEDEFTIIATKDGYKRDEIKIALNKEASFWEKIFENPNFIIVIGGIILIFAIIFVHFRQKHTINARASEISQDKRMQKYKEEIKITQDGKEEEILYASSVKEGVRVSPKDDPKVEEIRISRPKPEKEVVDVAAEKDETDKIIEKKNRETRDMDWFEGDDEIRYEINKLTGEVDEEGLDKWYEGVDSLKDKINEKVKKKDKKDKEEEGDY